MISGTVGPVDPHPAADPAGRVEGPTVPTPASARVLLSAERARLTTVPVPVERVRLRKVVVSREETITVTVRHEELRIVHEGVVPGEASHTESSAMPFEIVLHEERLVVDRVVVPVERVRVTVDQVVEDVDVSSTLRHERVDVTREAAAPPL